jgi:glutamate N-acetyltransferase/amino-acid N-acetyltransferase
VKLADKDKAVKEENMNKMESGIMENRIGKVNIIEGGVTAAKGFEAAAAAAEIKYKGRTDMALIYSQTPCQAAGTFTSNVVKAAPVKWDQKIVAESPFAQAVVVNSGIANACTGAEGYGYCKETAEECAKALNIPEDAVLVASTGVIGMQLPIDRLKKGIALLKEAKGGTAEHGTAAAKAIMTTDTVHKEIAVQVELGGKTVTIGGMCKGSGMIHPNMCTMLAFVTTDVCISKEMLQKAVSEDVKDTFNMISVDGDTSTNDTLLVLANGAAKNPQITKENEDYGLFAAALNTVNTYLAKKMAGDGEGATALFEVKIVGAETKADAVTLSKSVVTSSLVKAAVYGHDANWGRILCAMGYSGVEFDPEKVDLFFESAAGRIQIIENGVAVDYSEEEATRILSEPEVTAIADVKMGDASATAWGCDLTYDYVKINADYRS